MNLHLLRDAMLSFLHYLQLSSSAPPPPQDGAGIGLGRTDIGRKM